MSYTSFIGIKTSLTGNPVRQFFWLQRTYGWENGELPDTPCS